MTTDPTAAGAGPAGVTQKHRTAQLTRANSVYQNIRKPAR